MEYWINFCLVPLISALLAAKLVIQWFGRRLLDMPNQRSSHSQPTPRGGGIAILIATLTAIGLSHWLGSAIATNLWYLLLPGAVIALLGICDDLFNLNIKLRLAVQFLVASISSLALLGTAGQLNTGTQLIVVFGAPLGLVWLTNLYNFMDGINGLAALEAICVAAGMGIIFYLLDSHPEAIALLVILASASAGFLYWNFPAAKLFMGDSGSLFLGFSFGLLLLWTSHDQPPLAVSWLIMLAVFVVDASYTLSYRLLSGQTFYLPHRSHSYQKLASKLNSHPKATLLLVAINLLWLFPLALLCALAKLHPVMALVTAYLPLIYSCYRFKAGVPA